MNELQKKEFELLTLFTQVCDQLGLQYFLVCGSALGAVKYQGFIPWDDDVDVGLFRADYEIFLKEAPRLLPKHIFLQNYKTDLAFPAVFSKLRNSNTTFIERSASRLPINHGIYIDIFPLDAYPEKKREQQHLEWKKQFYRRLLSIAYLPNRKWKWIFIAPFRLLRIHKHTAFFTKKYEAAISKYPMTGARMVANHGNWQGKLEYAPLEQYGCGVWGTFEGLSVRLPEQYDAYLLQKYGNYRLDPPLDEQVGHHYSITYDCNRSYKDIL